MKSKLLTTLILTGLSLFSVSFEDGLKMESTGNRSKAIQIYNNYFSKNINSINTDTLISQVIHVSSLYNDTDLSINFLKKISSIIDNRDSRNIIYTYIGNIYELTGNILEAGKYYEKASINSDGSRNFNIYFNSLELLKELGYIERVKDKLLEIEATELSEETKKRYFGLLFKSYSLLGQANKANEFISYYTPMPDLPIYTNQLFTPNDFIGRENIVYQISHNNNAPELTYFYIGIFNKIPSGTINILAQLKLEWEYTNKELIVISDNKVSTEEKLKKAGISYDIR